MLAPKPEINHRLYVQLIAEESGAVISLSAAPFVNSNGSMLLVQTAEEDITIPNVSGAERNRRLRTRERDPICRWCGVRAAEDTHHDYPEGHDLRNAAHRHGLCKPCHRGIHHRFPHAIPLSMVRDAVATGEVEIVPVFDAA
jgi:hypothetical protein